MWEETIYSVLIRILDYLDHRIAYKVLESLGLESLSLSYRTASSFWARPSSIYIYIYNTLTSSSILDAGSNMFGSNFQT
jgi:hypothetical protein